MAFPAFIIFMNVVRCTDTCTPPQKFCTLGIGKAANPFQIFVIPRLLVFDVLTFVLMHFII